MARRRFRKHRSRQKVKFHETQRSSQQQCARSSKRYNAKMENAQPSSPVLMLFESPRHADPFDVSKLGPEITPRSTGIKSQGCSRHDNAIIGETLDPIDASSPGLPFPNSDENQTASMKRDEQSAASRDSDTRSRFSDTSRLAIFRPNFGPQLVRDDDGNDDDAGGLPRPAKNPCGEPETDDDGQRRFPEGEPDQPEDRRSLEITDDYRSTDKTLPMNDDLTREMNDYLNEQTSSAIIRHSTLKTQLAPILRDQYCFSEDRHRSSLLEDEFQSARTPVCESVDNDPSRSPDDLARKSGSILETKATTEEFDVALETIGKRLTLNWRELRRIFASGGVRLSKQTHKGYMKDAGLWDSAPLLSTYRWFTGDRKYPYVPVSASSSFYTPPSSSGSRNTGECGCRKSKGRSNVNPRSLLAQLKERGTERSEFTRMQDVGFVGSYEYSSPKQRTVLTREREHVEAQGEQRRSMTRPEVPFALSEETRRGKKPSFPLDQPLCDKTCRRRGSESTSTFDPNQPEVTDHGSSQNMAEYQDGACEEQASRSTATAFRDLQNYAKSRRRNIPRAIITWVVALCVWLKRRLLHLMNNYKKLRRSFASSPSAPETKNDRLLATLRIENEKMTCELSERMTRLSADFDRVRTDTRAALGTLTSEMNAVCGASQRMNESNALLMLELKKLSKTLEEIQSRSSQRLSSPVVSLPSSCLPLSSVHSLPPPPPPPLILPPMLPSQPPPTVPDNTSKRAISASVIPPPPPPPPSVFLPSSPGLSIQPTTPNSSRNNKCRTPTRKCSTPLLSRPTITVEDLLKVTLKKAPQSMKDARRNTVPSPRGPVVSLEMLRNVKLKSTKRRFADQTGRSPRSGRIVRNRAASNISLSPILTGSEGNLERILRRVEPNRPRRLLSASTSLYDHDFAKEPQSQSLETLMQG